MLLLNKEEIRENINFIVNFNQKYRIIKGNEFRRPYFTVKSRKDNKHIATLFVDDYYGDRVFTTSMFVNYDNLQAQIDVAYFLNSLSMVSIHESNIHLETLYHEDKYNKQSFYNSKSINRNYKKQIKNLMRKVKNV